MLIDKQNNIHLITFIDTEIEPTKGKILDIGAMKEDGNLFHRSSLMDFIQFLKGSEYVCGHNILNHDIKYIGKAIYDAGITPSNIIDTLYLSPLLFPTKPYHALLKDDKLQTEDTNNPLNDSIKARDLFNSEVAAFWQTDETLKEVFYLLLNATKEFGAFFRFLNYRNISSDVEALIKSKFRDQICEKSDLTKIIA
ncbi:RecQ family ATP-dependent DNA helicase, partial [Flavobacterium sp. LBUM151]